MVSRMSIGLAGIACMTFAFAFVPQAQAAQDTTTRWAVSTAQTLATCSCDSCTCKDCTCGQVTLCGDGDGKGKLCGDGKGGDGKLTLCGGDGDGKGKLCGDGKGGDGKLTLCGGDGDGKGT